MFSCKLFHEALVSFYEISSLFFSVLYFSHSCITASFVIVTVIVTISMQCCDKSFSKLRPHICSWILFQTLSGIHSKINNRNIGKSVNYVQS